MLVAFSGGADSAFLLARAVHVLGVGPVVAATAVSGSLPAAELAAAGEFARGLGVRWETPATDEMSREGYRANAGDRCFFCKSELIDVLMPLAGALGLAVRGHRHQRRRPGRRVPARDPGGGRAGRGHPAGRRRADQGRGAGASRAMGLVTWDKPAAACLSSRIAYGIHVTPARLSRVERAEAALRAALTDAGLAVRDLRVRDLGEAGARVEVDRALVPAVAARPDLLAAVSGFGAVTLDPLGFRSGSLNSALDERFR